ncbi:MAG: tripartite tricarboxylate transporter TctB family protein [Clostridia bacterium]|nr:tripartite tricarboxylate transporter TctB family protein [Clostridia bacterium]MBQ4608389.1 tripartite tricarboxylate transporter TctB family protein [Clostridia bacterium]MBQ6858997.1 tripartite tricarboxylate transporter TctB family protein [Clostridia bacterium]MBQ7051757.1 tripartite tricarboxylate transporter TctB family protein [Clostridia bacterium]
MFELIMNVLLVVFLGFSYFTHVLEAPVPVKVQKNPYAFQPDTWPKVIIILLEICLIINIIQIIKRNKGKEDFTLKAFIATIPNFFKSKMFLGIIILTVASLLLETIGFVVTAILVLFAYGALLGEKNFVRLGIASVVIALVLYIVFSGLLSVNLPRGTIGFLRDFALFLESIVAGVKGIFG